MWVPHSVRLLCVDEIQQVVDEVGLSHAASRVSGPNGSHPCSLHLLGNNLSNVFGVRSFIHGFAIFSGTK